MSNRLGRMLRYFSEAWLEAAQPWMAKAQPRQSNFGTSLDSMTRNEFHRAPEDNQYAYRLAVTSAWVYSDMALIANRVASTDAMPQVKRRNDEDGEVMPDHPFALLLNQPNPFMSRSFLMRYTANWYDLQGNAYWFLATPTPGNGEIQEIWPLPANQVAPQPQTLRDGQGHFRGQAVIDYLYQHDGVEEWLPGENIVHFRAPNPFDYWIGLSPLTAALLAMEMDEAQAAWVRDFFKKENAIPSSVISLSETLSEAEFEAQIARLRAQLNSGQRRLFTRSGDLKAAVISQTLEQMEILESRAFTRDEIDRVYGIPEGLISGGLSGDSRLAAEIAFARNTVQPRLDYFAEQIGADVLPFYGDESLYIEAPNIVPQDRALEVQEYTIYSSDRSINENRQRRGMDAWQPPEEFSELAQWADVPVRLLDIAKAKLNVPQPAESPGVGSMEGSQDPEAMTDDMAGKAALDLELKRWRKVALKAWRDSGDATAREFTSDIIPAVVREAITERLAEATDETEVKAAFAAPFLDWRHYP